MREAVGSVAGAWGVGPRVTEPHALYRFYGDEGLLYVGISSNVGTRWKGHTREKPWWAEVTHATIEHYEDRDSALVAETVAIKSERPKYNVAQASRTLVSHPSRRSARREYGTGSLTERRPGVWRLRVFVGRDPITGTPRHLNRTFRGGKRSAQRELANMVREVRGA